MVVADGSVTRSLVDMYKQVQVLRDGSAGPDYGEELDKSFIGVYSSVFVCFCTTCQFLHRLSGFRDIFHGCCITSSIAAKEMVYVQPII